MTVAAPQRADARRNHDRLLLVAAEAFSETGVDTPLETIARNAGVGIGTLYRHFPTRDSLIEAVYRHEVATLCEQVAKLLAKHPADEALRRWLHEFVKYAASKRGMATALKSALGDNNDLFAETRDRLIESITAMLEAGRSAGILRGDVEPLTVLRAVSGACSMSDQPGWQRQATQVSDLVVDGLRHRG